MIAQYAPYVMGAVLILAVAFELRSGKIPNWLTLIPFILFIAVLATSENRLALGWQLGFAAVVFGVGLLLFAYMGFGAGAVKLMSGLALFLPISQIVIIATIFFVSVFLVGFVIAQLRKFIGDAESDWHVLRGRSIPMSLPLAVTGLGILFVV